MTRKGECGPGPGANGAAFEEMPSTVSDGGALTVTVVTLEYPNFFGKELSNAQ